MGTTTFAVTDAAILDAYHRLPLEGVFAEPASAASVAGLLALAAAGKVEPGQTIVCVLTGHGLKDPERAIAGVGGPVPVPVDADAIARELGL